VSTSLTGLGAVTLFVEDLPRAAAFYRDVFGLESVVEDDDSTAFRFGTTILNLLRVSAAPGLIGPAQVAGPDAGSRVQFTVWVTDVDSVVAELTESGVELLSGPMDRAWGQRTAAFADPAGHVWEVAQSIGPG
jgi:catechol 2,3-dioxygenase-like lactoylglutathione lyase family enzyme